MTYTEAVLIGLVGTVVLDIAVLRTNLVRRKAFWTAYAICLGFQLIVNGVLTGQRLVTYSPDAILGWRVAYAPVEDVGFGFALVLQTLAWWVWWGRRDHQARANPGTATDTRRRVPTEARRSSTE
jgi:lycopene cyclase domain-containing protein